MHESRLGRVERYIRPFGTFWQRFRLGRYGPYIGTRDNEDVSTFASSGKDDTDPRDLSGAYAAIRAYALKLYGGGVVFNAGATGTGGDWSLTFTRPSTGMTENVTVVWPSDTPSNGDVLTVLSYAPGLIELEWAAGGGGGSQAAIQFQDEGSNLGAAGTADTLDFTGAGVTATRVGDVVTVDIPGGGGSLDGAITVQIGPPPGSVGAILSTQVVYIQCPADYTLTGWQLYVSPAATVSVDVRVDAFPTLPDAGDSITSGSPPSTTAATNNTGSVAGWTSTTLTRGEWVALAITANDVATFISLQLQGTRT